MENKCKPITAKASQSSKPSPNKYMAALVSTVGKAYGSNKFLDAGEAMGVGFDRQAKLNKEYKDQ